MNINTLKNNSIVNKKSNTLVPVIPCNEVELHYKRPLFSSMPHISSSHSVNTIIRKYVSIHQLDLRESMWVILLNSANRVLGISTIAEGTSRGVQMNARYIFQLALLSNASALILVHNHPSGNLTFSKRDILETKKIKRLAKHLEIILLDHLIITSESFLSMSEEGKL